jgi:1-deoxy-D-xylulose-5-phosphate reductoisomerase
VSALPPKHLVILGSTGSIGRQAIEVLPCVPHVRLVGLAAQSNVQLVLEQAAASGAAAVALRDPAAADEAAARADIGLVRPAGVSDEGDDPSRAAPSDLRVFAGDAGVTELIHEAADTARAEGAALTVLNGIVGAAGLRATLAALECGATLALANKESMVAGGPFVVAAARASGSRVVPVDSEHNALFQCLEAGAPAHASRADVEELLLTGSGGPFRTATDDELARATPEQALAHPTWSMGPKITIDSATLMNKGLEVIEAHYLFGVPYERIAVLLNPQSVIHSMVRFGDGAILAHLGVPDMRVPIAYALGYPDVRPTLPMVRRLDFLAGDVTFATPDLERFRCLALAIEAGEKAAIVELEAGCATGACVDAPRGTPTASRGTGRAAAERPPAAPAAPRTVAAPIVLNAANEVAVSAFLAGRLPFTAIADVVEKCLTWLGDEPVESLDDVFACDAEARSFAGEAAGGTVQ